MTAAAAARVRHLLAHHPLIDGHNDLAWAARTLAGGDWDRVAFGTGEPRTHTDLPRLRAGGVGGQFWSVYVPGTFTGDEAVRVTLEQIDTVLALAARHPADLAMAHSARQVREAFGAGRVASLLGAEGGHSIGCSLPVLRVLHALGVRYLTLTHNQNVPWADAATDEPRLGGLSRFGEAVVAEMNRLGMVVDLSHVSPDTMRHALEVTDSPVMFSHSSARALCDSPRNVPDDVLRSLAVNGGICMVTFVPYFVSQAAATWQHRQVQRAREAGVDPRDLHALEDHLSDHAEPRPPAGIDDVVAHIEHVAAVAGVDCVGLGGDFDGVDELPVGLEDVGRYPALLTALAERGWSDADLVKLAGENVLRVLGRAEVVAAELAATRPPSRATYAELDGGDLTAH